MIQLFHVSKRYPGTPPALDDISLHLAKGEMAFLTGPSGAGKSTLLSLLFGAQPPSEGQILIDGQSIGRLNRAELSRLRRRVGVVFQDFKLLPGRSVFDNVAVGLEVQGWPQRDIRRKVDLLLRWVGLSERADARPPLLSGGEQQRVAIARALVADPAVLLADEPTGNLDEARAEDTMALLSAASARGTTVLVATHDHGLLARYARRVLVLDAGRLIADGEPSFSGDEG